MIYATWTHDQHHTMITTFDWKLEVVHRKSQLQWIALLVWFDYADVVWTYVLTVNIITAIGSYLFAKWIWQKSTPQSSCQQNFLYMVSLSLTKFCRIFFQFKCSYIESEIFLARVDSKNTWEQGRILLSVKIQVQKITTTILPFSSFWNSCVAYLC